MKKSTIFRGLGPFLLLWSTQALSSLGSAMTSFGLVIWSYEQHGSALATALLSVCTYAPYVLLSVFAGVVSDRWDKRRTMLVCDSLAAAVTLAVWGLLHTGRLMVWHLYVLNAVSGLMNAVQQPASEVAVSLLTPKEQYQRVGGLRALSSSLVTMLTPLLATAVTALAGMDTVLLADLVTFAAAFAALFGFIRLPQAAQPDGERASFRRAAGEGFSYLRRNPGILGLIGFLAAINLIASAYEAALPAMVLSRPGGGQAALGAVTACAGAANLAGSVLAALLPAPKNRVRVIGNALLFAMSTENFFLAFGRSAPVWCAGAVLGWLAIPLMNANLDAVLRSHIPLDRQGRVYAVRNALQFFTIPVGYLLGGALVDRVFEPLMAAQPADSLLVAVFGGGKGSGAAVLYAVLAVAGILVCLVFRRLRPIRALEREDRT